MDKQQVFDTVCKHLMKQRARAVDKTKPKIKDERFGGILNHQCVYRTADGKKKCAAGCLIPNNKYNRELEGKSVYSLHKCFFVDQEEVLGLLRQFLENLQNIHDDPRLSPRKDWAPKLRELAVAEGLTQPECIKEKPIKWTKQKIFDKVYKHLLTQGVQCKTIQGCLYRGPDGLMCAAGCLIPDDKYKYTYEGRGWYEISKDFPELLDFKDFIFSLQQIHDVGRPPKWEHELNVLAASHELKVPKWKPKKQST